MTYKSKWEGRVADRLKELGLPVKYEKTIIRYVVPESLHTYKPDFTITKNVFIEAKGKFDAQDRKKHLLLLKQHPDKEIWLVFMNPRNRLSKKSKTTYMEWCQKNGVRFLSMEQLGSLKRGNG